MKFDKILNKKAFIFDMDGTLVDLEDLNFKAYGETISEKFDHELKHEDYKKYFAGVRTQAGFDGYLKSKDIENYDVQKIIKHYRAKKDYQLRNNTEEVVKVKDGVEEILGYTQNQDKKVALATSSTKKFVKIIFDHYDLFKYFDVILAAEDVDQGKPNPEVFNKAMKQLEVSKKESVIFEDSKNGIQAALISGTLTVGIHTEGLNDKFVDKADVVISDYRELLR